MSHWKDFSTDPNSREAIDVREKTLLSARAKPIDDRLAYFSKLVEGRRVLDVGVVDHMVEQHNKTGWLHATLCAKAAYCLGVDVLPDAVRTLQEQGYHVQLLDITSDKIDEQFDVMIVGEVIEHLGNPGALFEAAKRCLIPGGRLVLSTPNPFYLSRVRDGLHGTNFDSVDHVALYSPSCIVEMAERANMRLDSYRGIKVAGGRTLIGRLVLNFAGILSLGYLRPEAFCNNLIFECTA